MMTFTNDLYARMSEALEQLTFTSDNILQRAERSYKVVEQTLGELKEFIVHYTFKDEPEEIKFFKEIKPMFQKELIYFWEVFEVEAWKPPVEKDEIIMHYKIGAKRADLYFKMCNDLYTYYRTGSCEHDEAYFLRNQNRPGPITPISVSDIDPKFSTAYSFEFAKMQAYEQFANYLHQRIYGVEHPGTGQIKGERKILLWTDSIADFTEMGYGIYARGSVNHGKADIRDIMGALEIVFGISAGNYYRTFLNLRIRKNRTPYWDGGKNDLTKLMDNTDLNRR